MLVNQQAKNKRLTKHDRLWVPGFQLLDRVLTNPT